MESRVQPELALKRMVCESCGEGTFEFIPEAVVKQEYICSSCST